LRVKGILPATFYSLLHQMPCPKFVVVLIAGLKDVLLKEQSCGFSWVSGISWVEPGFVLKGPT